MEVGEDLLALGPISDLAREPLLRGLANSLPLPLHLVSMETPPR